MAQTNFTPILTYKSDTAAAVPSAGNLTNSANGAELAVNTADKRLFTKDSGGNVVELGTNPSSLTLPNSTANGVVYANGSKVLTTGSALTFDGANLGVGANITASAAAAPSFTVGTGSGSPAITLYSSTTGSSQISFADATSGSGAYDGYILYDQNSQSMQFGRAAAEQMRLTSTGLGIGTSSPLTPVHAVGAIQSQRTGGVAQYARMVNSGGTATFISDNQASGTYTGFDFQGLSTASGTPVTYATINGSGNLGLGVTPSAWRTTFTDRALDIGTTTGLYFQHGGTTALLNNAYRNSANTFIYKATGVAGGYWQESNGTHYWTIAPSGTAGDAVSFTQAMTLGSNGYLSVGDTSTNYPLTIKANGTNSYAPMLTINPATGTNASYIYMNNGGSGGFFVGRADSTGKHSGTTISSYDSFVWNTGVQSMVFGTNNAERARIDSSGNLLVGTTSVGGEGGLTIIPNGSAGAPITRFNRASTTSTSYPVVFQNGGSDVGYISYSNTAVSYVTSSDYRLKNTIAPMTGALAKVALLKPCTYKWNADGSDGEGFIAHELAEVVPQCVTGEKDAVDEEGNPKYQGIDVSFLVATLTAAIQEQQAIITALTARVAALESSTLQ